MKVEEVKRRLAELGAQPKRSLGQNFLLNEAVIDKILTATLAFRPQRLIEVGPGLGALTQGLRQSQIPLTLIELDRRFADYWRGEGVQVVEGDALKWNWQSLEVERNIVVVSNLPYQIAASLVLELSCGPQAVDGMVLMFQKEVAERITAAARTADYGLLTVIAQTFWEIEKLTDAGPRDFYPAPKVISRVLTFARRPPPVAGRAFLKFVKVAFQQRRKLLARNLQTLSHELDFSWWQQKLRELGLSETARAEELKPGQFVDLYRIYEATRGQAAEGASHGH